MHPTANDCAHKLIDVVPGVMQAIRAEIRRQHGRDLSILQLRTLAYLGHNPGATLSAVAEHVGLTLSSMSTQVTKLVQRSLVQRTEAPLDRRYITLTLTMHGLAVFEAVRREAEINLAAACEKLSPEERATVVRALQILHTLFSPSSPSIETE
jgi:DNA-binding MarR family transcriptional regulator